MLCQRIRMISRFFPVAALLALPYASASAALILDIDLSTQTFDWVEGTSITRIGEAENNNFGASSDLVQAVITSPLPAFSSPIGTTLSSVLFYVNSGGDAITGLAFATSGYPEEGAVISGTSALPSAATFSDGDFAAFVGLSPGSFYLAPLGANWTDGVTIRVTTDAVPEPTTLALLGLGLAGLGFSRRRLSDT